MDRLCVGKYNILDEGITVLHGQQCSINHKFLISLTPNYRVQLLLFVRGS